MDGNKLSTIEMVVFEPLFKLFRGGPNRSPWPSACVFMFFFLEQVYSGRGFRVVVCLCTNYVFQAGLKPGMLELIACILMSGRRSTFPQTIKGTRVHQAQDSCGHICSALCNSFSPHLLLIFWNWATSNPWAYTFGMLCPLALLDATRFSFRSRFVLRQDLMCPRLDSDLLCNRWWPWTSEALFIKHLEFLNPHKPLKAPCSDAVNLTWDRILQSLSFCVWLISCSTVSSGPIHMSICVKILSPFEVTYSTMCFIWPLTCQQTLDCLSLLFAVKNCRWEHECGNTSLI